MEPLPSNNLSEAIYFFKTKGSMKNCFCKKGFQQSLKNSFVKGSLYHNIKGLLEERPGWALGKTLESKRVLCMIPWVGPRSNPYNIIRF